MNLLPRAIESVLSQGFKNWELLIVDDGSTDRTAQVVDQYLEDKRIIYIQLPLNRGVGVARNKGVMLARAQWIALLDSDNALAPTALATMCTSVKSSQAILMHKFLVRSFDSQLMCDALEFSVTISGRDYLCGKYQGEFDTLVARKCLVQVPFLEEFSGGEGITWSRIAMDVKQVVFRPYETGFYETSGSDRLSMKNKNYSRLAKAFGTEIILLWRQYIRYCPSQLVIRIIKFIFYSLASRIKV